MYLELLVICIQNVKSTYSKSWAEDLIEWLEQTFDLWFKFELSMIIQKAFFIPQRFLPRRDNFEIFYVDLSN